MIKLLFLMLFSMASIDAIALAWVEKAGAFRIQHNMYKSKYSASEDLNESLGAISLSDQLVYKSDTGTSHALDYGLTDAITISAGLNRSLKTVSHNNIVRSSYFKVENNEDFAATKSNGRIGAKILAAKDENGVISVGYNYYPMELTDYKSNQNYDKALSAHEVKFAVGNNFQRDDKSYSYLEWVVGIKKYSAFGEYNLNASWEYGYKIGKYCGLAYGFSLSFNELSHSLAKYDSGIINAGYSAIRLIMEDDVYTGFVKADFPLNEAATFHLQGYYKMYKSPRKDNTILTGISYGF